MFPYLRFLATLLAMVSLPTAGVYSLMCRYYVYRSPRSGFKRYLKSYNGKVAAIGAISLLVLLVWIVLFYVITSPSLMATADYIHQQGQ